ncbi:hypothetical protein ASD54_01890 [Rhizobium sp. Root149]|nr:hypothetical protein ASD54_01890 [Rhizobium sp. Root149]
MGIEEKAPAGLLGRSLTALLLSYALVLQLFIGAYFQQSMVVQALNGDFTICSTHLGSAAGEDPAGSEGKAQCLALCQLACGIAPGLASFLRILPPHEPTAQTIVWQAQAETPLSAKPFHAPHARGPPQLS